MTEKLCRCCKQKKELVEFHRWKFAPDGHRYVCKECRKAQYKKAYAAHPEKWAVRNPDTVKTRKRKWYDKNRDKIRVQHRDYVNVRRAECLFERLNHIMSSAIRRSMRGTKKGSWTKYVGYTVAELKKHIENQFVTGMSWENYGSAWHIDHKVPKSWFNYTSMSDEEFRRCWGLDNLQPKFAIDNMRKGGRYADG